MYCFPGGKVISLNLLKPKGCLNLFGKKFSCPGNSSFCSFVCLLIVCEQVPQRLRNQAGLLVNHTTRASRRDHPTWPLWKQIGTRTASRPQLRTREAPILPTERQCHLRISVCWACSLVKHKVKLKQGDAPLKFYIQAGSQAFSDPYSLTLSTQGSELI